jgi:hypothetical protein
MKQLIILFFCFVVFSFGTCRKSGVGCTGSVYGFEAKAKIINHSDSINIGDTIWLEIVSPVSQIDANTGQIINYSKAANLGTAIGFGELVSPTMPVYAANDFKYVLQKGQKLDNPNVNVVREYLFSENQLNYEFRLGIIPTRKGIFSIGLSNAANVYRANDKCTKAGYRIYFTETNQHLYFIKQVFGTEPDPPPNGTYCFKVK